jgi:hypothetical protein
MKQTISGQSQASGKCECTLFAFNGGLPLKIWTRDMFPSLLWLSKPKSK